MSNRSAIINQWRCGVNSTWTGDRNYPYIFIYRYAMLTIPWNIPMKYPHEISPTYIYISFLLLQSQFCFTIHHLLRFCHKQLRQVRKVPMIFFMKSHEITMKSVFAISTERPSSCSTRSCSSRRSVTSRIFSSCSSLTFQGRGKRRQEVSPVKFRLGKWELKYWNLHLYI